ncbi:MAG: dihydroorotate dehydrogenase electron transfer subunit [Firmicutes bacterium]|nr:dihydroorotate dehydrogenase electron transfer subunit [Bacillota bacterium]
MKEVIFTIGSNELIAKNTYEMVLKGDTSEITRPGQFVNIKLKGFFLRRPISVCHCEEDRMVLIYKVVGEGTELMAGLEPGTELNVLTGLGNGFDTELAGDSPVLIGGGVGIPPMYGLCEALKARMSAENIKVVLGFNTADEAFYLREFSDLGVDVRVATLDGSVGTKGFVTDVLKELDYSFFYTCGPMPMFRAIEKVAKTSGQYSFEERMGCGFGACMGCSMTMADGSYKRVCKEGPVFRREEILWK